MFSFQWRGCFNASRQQIMAILLIVAALAALLPIPLVSVAGKNGKDRSKPFPCQDRPCGCRSAEHCKKKCCCFTSEQKLAWANRYGIDPAEVVADSVEKTAEPVAKRKSCCTPTPVAKSETKPTDRVPNPTAKTTARYRVVIGVIAQECQGVAQTVSGQFVFVIPSVISLKTFIEPTGERIIHEGSRFVLPLSEPPVPPPRQLAA